MDLKFQIYTGFNQWISITWDARHKLETRMRLHDLRSVDSLDASICAEIRTRIPDTIAWDYNFEPAGANPLTFTVKIWHNNMPHNKIADRKGHQGWMKLEGPHFIFPGGGTMFPDGAEQYIEKLGQYIPMNGGVLRTALDMGCGVASFGGFLLSQNIVTMSFAPRDSHKSQIQFSLERRIPAFVAMLGTRRLPFPTFGFDLVHCSRCLIPFTAYNATYFLEVDRLLRPGGYLVVSGPPV